MRKLFRFYVKDNTGHIEMEISHYKYDDFIVRFPRFTDTAPELIRPNRGYVIMNVKSLAMLIFAYSESEYFRFVEKMEKFYKSWMKMNKCNLSTCRYNADGTCENKETRKECVEVSRAVLCLEDNDEQSKEAASSKTF